MSRPLVGLAALIAATATFKTQVGAATAAEALTSVHYPAFVLDTDNPEPRNIAIICEDDVCQWELDRYLKGSGQLLLTLQFQANPDYAPDSKDALLYFTNQAGNIVLEALALANTPAPDGSHYWNAIKFNRLISPALCDERKLAEQEDPDDLYYEVTFMVDWV